jgi:hypothetical protein
MTPTPQLRTVPLLPHAALATELRLCNYTNMLRYINTDIFLKKYVNRWIQIAQEAPWFILDVSAEQVKHVSCLTL